MLLRQRLTLIAFAHTSKGANAPDLIAQTYFSTTCPRIWCRRFLFPKPSGFSM